MSVSIRRAFIVVLLGGSVSTSSASLSGTPPDPPVEQVASQTARQRLSTDDRPTGSSKKSMIARSPCTTRAKRMIKRMSARSRRD